MKMATHIAHLIPKMWKKRSIPEEKKHKNGGSEGQKNEKNTNFQLFTRIFEKNIKKSEKNVKIAKTWLYSAATSTLFSIFSKIFIFLQEFSIFFNFFQVSSMSFCKFHQVSKVWQSFHMVEQIFTKLNKSFHMSNKIFIMTKLKKLIEKVWQVSEFFESRFLKSSDRFLWKLSV